MNTSTDTCWKAVESIALLLLAEFLWLEYQDAAADAQAALDDGDKLRAVGLAITAYKIRSRYESIISRSVFC